MIPFTVFSQAGLDLDKYVLIDRGPESTVTVSVESNERDDDNNRIMIDESRHFTGASLFEVDGKSYLFDIDQIEITHKIFNAFLVAVTPGVRTIAEAYLSQARRGYPCRVERPQGRASRRVVFYPDRGNPSGVV